MNAQRTTYHGGYTMIQGAIFGLEGVLVDAREWHRMAVDQALAEFQIEVTEGEHEMLFDGLAPEKKLEFLFWYKNVPRKWQEKISQLTHIYFHNLLSKKCAVDVPTYQMMLKLLACDMKMSVCSQFDRDEVGVMLLKSQLTHFFSTSYCREDVIEPLPHPELYLRAIEKMGIPPEDTVVIESSDEALMAAEQLGAHTLALKPSEKLSGEIIEHFFEIQRIAGGVIEILEGIAELEQVQSEQQYLS